MARRCSLQRFCYETPFGQLTFCETFYFEIYSRIFRGFWRMNLESFPMTLQVWWAFTLVSTIAIVCPGPAVSLVISNALHFRFNAVFWQVVGNLFGLAIISSLVILGIDQISAFSTTAISTLRYAGALYIVAIGLRSILSQNTPITQRWGTLSCGNKCSKVAFVEGFFVAVSNPQTFLFFLSLFPNFINVNASIGPQYLLLVPSVLLISFLSLMSYGTIAHFGKRRLTTHLNPKTISNAMGYCLIVFGIGLMLMGASA